MTLLAAAGGGALAALILPLSVKRRETVPKRLWLPGALPEPLNFPRNEKPCWIHALSVGEVLSAIPLIRRLKAFNPNLRIVFSVSTASGFDIAIRVIEPDVDRLVYYPYDLICSVKTAFNFINPACLLIVESDVWPNVVFEARRRRIPICFLNARLSDKSFRRYRQFSFFFKPVFRAFNRIGVQSTADARRFSLLGVAPERLTVTGNIKFDQPCAPPSFADERRTAGQCAAIAGTRPIFIAGSTHEPEEAVLLDALSIVKRAFPDLLMLIAPRDPERAGEIRTLCRRHGFRTVCWQKIAHASSPDREQSRPDVIIIDCIGILRELYAVADITFIGGSLVRLGGHNPLEAAVFSKPILFGPHMSNFKEISRFLLDRGGALPVSSAEDIHQAVVRLLEDRAQACRIGRRAFRIFRENRGAIDKTLDILRNLKLCCPPGIKS